MFFEFAELSMMSSGMVDQLIDGVKGFGSEIEDDLREENKFVNY